MDVQEPYPKEAPQSRPSRRVFDLQPLSSNGSPRMRSATSSNCMLPLPGITREPPLPLLSNRG